VGLTIPTLPGGDNNTVQPKRRGPQPSHKHQPLHMMDGLKYCWCQCASCWQPLGFTSKGAPRGVCICRDCPCNHREA
jgi:hypothetical protein